MFLRDVYRDRRIFISGLYVTVLKDVRIKRISAVLNAKKRDFFAVFQDDQGIYMQKVRDMIANNEIRLIVNINDLRRKNPTRAAS